MKVEEIVRKVERFAPPLEFEPAYFYGREPGRVESVAVCVDPTQELMERAAKEGVSLLVSHHRPTSFSERFASGTGLYGMVVHLQQDTAQGGNIDTFAEAIGLKNIEPFTIMYKGLEVPRGAVVGDYGEEIPRKPENASPVFEMPVRYTRPERITKSAGELTEEVGIALQRFDLKPRITTLDNGGYGRISRVGVSCGAALKPEFLEQISREGIHAYVAAEMEQPTVMLAQELGITLVDAGHYETEVPGMISLAENLGAEFMPNRYEFR